MCIRDRLWHGADWNFVLWGLFFAVFLMLEKAFLLKPLQKLSLIHILGGQLQRKIPQPAPGVTHMGVGGGVEDDGRCILILAVTSGVKSELVIRLPFQHISKFDFFSTPVSYTHLKPGPIIRTNSAIAVTTMLDLGMGVTFLTEDIWQSSTFILFPGNTFVFTGKIVSYSDTIRKEFFRIGFQKPMLPPP